MLVAGFLAQKEGQSAVIASLQAAAESSANLQAATCKAMQQAAITGLLSAADASATRAAAEAVENRKHLLDVLKAFKN